jgi:peptide/nickel transport system substrate-binding protein
MTLTKNPAFNWGNQMAPQLGASPVLLNQEATIPGIINPGQTITVTALQTPDGSNQAAPAPGATVTLQMISNGAVAYQTNMTSNSAGQVTFTVPSTLPLGAYIISLWTATSASTLFNPLTQAVELSAASVTTTSTTTPTTSTTTTTTTTSSTSSTSIALSPAILGGLAIVTVVIVAAFALGSSRRRSYGLPSVHPAPR